MTTSLQRTSLGELGYTPLAATSLGELGEAILIVAKGGIDDGFVRIRKHNHDDDDLQILLMLVTAIEQDRDT